MALKNPTLQRLVNDLKAKLPAGEKQRFFEQVMVAGLKIMFGKDADLVDRRIAEGNDPIDGIGQGVVDLLGLIYKGSRNTMPWDVGVVAGYALVAEVLDYAEEKGLAEATPENIDRAMQVFIETLLQKFGVGQEQMQQLIAKVQDPKVQAEYKAKTGKELQP